MTFPYTIHAEARYVRVIVSGVVRGRDIAESIEAVYSDPLWRAGFDVIWDCSGITSLMLEKDDQAGFVNLQVKFEDVAGRGRDIIVAPRDIDFNMAKMYGMRARDAREVHVFRTEAEANLFLGRSTKSV